MIVPADDLPILEYRAQLHEQLRTSAVRPKFATAPDLTRPSIGRRQARFSNTWLRSPFMPHQHLISDLAGELKIDDETGQLVPAHSLVVVTIQRQAGKSHLDMAQAGERCFVEHNFRSWYTAQTGGDARDQFLKFNDEVMVGTPLAAAVRTKRGNGHEQMTFANGSTIRPYPPTEEGLHGKQVDRNSIDEGWAFSREEGKALLQASGPAKLTRSSRAQTFVWSAGGTATSSWLAELVARGRGGDPTMLYIEFGVPDDLKIEGTLSDDDYRAIAAHHPAVGHTITLGALKALRAELPDDAEYARAAGNRWTEIIGGALSTEVWEAARWNGGPIPATAPVGYGAAVAEDRSETVVCAAGLVQGVVVIEVVAVLAGAWKIAPDVAYLTADAAIAVDHVGPSATLADDLTLPTDRGGCGRELVELSTTAATDNFVNGISARAIQYRQHVALDEARKVAGLRSVGDGGRAWARKAAGSSMAAIEAASLAAWALGHRPAAPIEIKVRVPGE